MITRRSFCVASATSAATTFAAPAWRWTPEWDRALLTAAAAGQDAAWDPAERMLRRRLGSDYSYHSGLRAATVHPTRDTLDYALTLLEVGGADRARRAEEAIARLLDLQDTDPGSKWYGIWGWYMEEPPPKMAPSADWNWADFNGSLLLLIETRHGNQLPSALRAKIREGIRHAAASVRRRNVSMNYTNIAVQGSFVVLAAAELLDDRDLMGYATERLRRFAANVDQTGSFAEYNSPTYVNVTIANLTRVRMTVRHAESLALAEKIHERAWLHIGKHWHAPSRQLSAPMSRCYRTDIGQPLWLQKALDNRIAFASLADIRERRAPSSAETATLDYRCPSTIAPLFLEAGPPRQHRELFTGSVQGTTWLDRRYTIGSANRGNFWVQSRSLAGYWGEGGRTGGYLQMRFLKDDYDFTSALLYSVQEKNCVLGLVNFRTPGGDKHPSLDPVRDGQFRVTRLRLRIDLSGIPDKTLPLVREDAVAVDTGMVKIWIRVPDARLGERQERMGKWAVERQSGLLTLSYDLLREREQVMLRWQETARAFMVFTLAVEDTADPLGRFAERMRSAPFRAPGAAEWEWSSPAGKLGLAGGTAPAAFAEQEKAFRDTMAGKPAPVVRLSDARLV
jgi:hypothetical protein